MTSTFSYMQNPNFQKPIGAYQQISRENISNSNPCQMNIPMQNPIKNDHHIFKTLFGSNTSDWPFSEQSLQKALDLRIAQEKTKQEYYKVEKLNRIIEVLKLAAITKVPGNLIPSMFDSDSSSLESKNTNSFQSVTPSPTVSPISNSSSPIERHTRSRTISSISDLNFQSNPGLSNTQQQSNNNPMKNFKFGSGSSFRGPKLTASNIHKNRTSLPPKHQLSPSRIGAHVISSLNRYGNRNSVNIMKLRHGSYHNRTLSLPVTVSIPESRQMHFHNNIQNDQSDLKKIIIPNLNYQKCEGKFNKGLENHNTFDGLNDENDNANKSGDMKNVGVETIIDQNNHISSSSPTFETTKTGSPLKEMTRVDEETENASTIMSENSSSMIDTSVSNTSVFVFSSHKKMNQLEPKTP